MKTDRIETRHIDFGVGVLRGVLSRPELRGLLTPNELEVAIEHTRAAARFIESHQKLTRKKRAARIQRVSRRT